MTRTERSFPRAFRVLAAACALISAAWLVPAAGAQTPTKQDVEDAKAKYERYKTELAELRAELDAVKADLNAAAFEVDRYEGLVEQVEAELLVVRKRMERNRARYERIRQRLNERAAQAFMAGPGSNLQVLLGAESLADLSDRIQYVEAVAESDAALAQEVENLSNLLVADEAELEELEATRQRQLDEAQQIEDAVAADLARVAELEAEMESKTAEALDLWKDSKRQYEKAQAELAALAQGTPNIDFSVIPDGWRFDRCPVAGPNGFGDGFGAPRYVGGYHLHRGVDIVAPEGTPVVATFDGVARDASNAYGGIAVQVYGQYGYTYNAHLQSIAKLGAVQAGDVIGYVSSTGLAGGSTPHDHFEFHPGYVPANWPKSYYGYSVIDGAINPYPLLVDACR